MAKQKINVKGMFRIKIGEGKGRKAKVVGDSGWIPNTVTEDGFDNYIVGAVGAVAGSKQVGFVFLATQTAAVNSTQTGLTGEVTEAGRNSVSNSLVGAGTLRCTASFSSSENTTGYDIGAAGLINATTSNATMGFGQTFASSNWASNQNVSVTYDVQFS